MNKVIEPMSNCWDCGQRPKLAVSYQATSDQSYNGDKCKSQAGNSERVGLVVGCVYSCHFRKIQSLSKGLVKKFDNYSRQLSFFKVVKASDCRSNFPK